MSASHLAKIISQCVGGTRVVLFSAKWTEQLHAIPSRPLLSCVGHAHIPAFTATHIYHSTPYPPPTVRHHFDALRNSLNPSWFGAHRPAISLGRRDGALVPLTERKGRTISERRKRQWKHFSPFCHFYLPFATFPPTHTTLYSTTHSLTRSVGRSLSNNYIRFFFLLLHLCCISHLKIRRAVFSILFELHTHTHTPRTSLLPIHSALLTLYFTIGKFEKGCFFLFCFSPL